MERIYEAKYQLLIRKRENLGIIVILKLFYLIFK